MVKLIEMNYVGAAAYVTHDVGATVTIVYLASNIACEPKQREYVNQNNESM